MRACVWQGPSIDVGERSPDIIIGSFFNFISPLSIVISAPRSITPIAEGYAGVQGRVKGNVGAFGCEGRNGTFK